jgi:transketolase
MTDQDLVERAINALRFLSVDAVQKANSGHPGLPMGDAAMAYVLWTRHLRFDPTHPKWPNRDRFILSAGHGSALLYSLLHLTGFDLPMDQIKQFRQLHSVTAGHPEYWAVPGIETTTGPLGQGFGNGVGMAIAREHMAALYNRDDYSLFDHYIYAIVSDGDLMEGISHEAASLAGHLRLGSLIYLYDNNHISIDGSTDLAFTEDRAGRFEAYGWHVQTLDDGNDVEAVDRAITRAKEDPRPSIIVARTHIGFGLPTKQDTAAAHGEPPGDEELDGAKEKLGWPKEPRFLVPDDVREHFQAAGKRGAKIRNQWVDMREAFAGAYPELSSQLDRSLSRRLPDGIERQLPVFDADPKGLATRASFGKALNAVAKSIPELIGGSADLTGSNKTDIKGEPAFSPDNRAARYLHFGVREHAMGGALSGLALYGGLIPYGGTFLVFSDYMRPTIRLAAMMGISPIYIFTHDSIGLGEDGPTHQPVEQLPSLRAIPNLVTIRPADANETGQAWLAAIERQDGPTALVLTRQKVPTFDRGQFASADGLHKGAYVMADFGGEAPQVILIGTGSEVQLAVEAGELLGADGIPARVVSMPSWELFERQPEAYREQVLPGHVKARVAVEAAVMLGWERWVGDDGAVVGMHGFGESAPYEAIYQDLGLTAAKVADAAREVLKRVQPMEAGA